MKETYSIQTKTTIFFLEDNFLQAKKLRIGLEKKGYNVQVFCKTEEFILAVENEKPSIVILDISMPEQKKDGIDVAFAIRESKSNQDIPIIFVSGVHDNIEYINRANKLEPRYSGYFKKSDKVINRICKAIKQESPKNENSCESNDRRIRENENTLEIRMRKNTWQIVAIEDIIYLEADDNYTKLFTDEGMTHAPVGLGRFFQEISPSINNGLFRCHASYGINFHHIRGKVNANILGGTIMTKLGKIKISRSKIRAFREAWELWKKK